MQLLENAWLGREDSNLRMAVPKTDLALGVVTLFLRTHRVVHRRISMGYGRSADSLPSPTQHEKG